MTDRVALITGAGSGVGRAAAIELANSGWTVTLAGRRTAPLEETVSMMNGAKSLVVPTDVCNPDSLEALFQKSVATFGRLDLLFNNAGRGALGLLEDLSFDDWQAVVDTNLTGSFLCTQHAFRIMKDQEPMGGANYKQRLHFRACAAT